MTLDEMISRLQEYREEFGGEAEVRLMTQQNWPFENQICGIVSEREMHEASENEDDEEAEDGECVHDSTTVYIVEGGQIGYGSKLAWEVCNR